MTKKVCVIGGSGFVGTNLCRALSQKQQEFEIIDIKMSREFPDKCKIGDVRDINSLRELISGDVVVNLAAVHRDDVRDKDAYTQTNVFGAENVATICLEKGISKIVFTSSVAVYGFAEAGTSEDGPIQPFNEYGRTKYEAEIRLRKWQEKSDGSLLIVRPTVIFGEGNRGNVYNLLRQIASGKFVMVGDGENKKSMAYVGNIVAFLESCIASQSKFAVFNYVDTPDLSMNELVANVQSGLGKAPRSKLRLPVWMGMCLGYLFDLISRLSGKRFSVSSIRVKKFVSSSQFATSAGQLEEFKPPFSLLEGIERTLESEFISPDPNREVFYTE